MPVTVNMHIWPVGSHVTVPIEITDRITGDAVEDAVGTVAWYAEGNATAVVGPVSIEHDEAGKYHADADLTPLQEGTDYQARIVISEPYTYQERHWRTARYIGMDLRK